MPGVKDADIQVLIDKYRDGNTNLINYTNLQKALEDLGMSLRVGLSMQNLKIL